MAATLSVQKSDPALREFGDIPAVSASDLKQHIGEAILQAMKGPLAIKRHNRTEFVMLPVEEFRELQRFRKAPLAALATEFDAMVARMNTATAKRGVKKLFQATSEELGKSAVKAAKAHGR